MLLFGSVNITTSFHVDLIFSLKAQGKLYFRVTLPAPPSIVTWLSCVCILLRRCAPLDKVQYGLCMFAYNLIYLVLSVRQARLHPFDSLTTEAQQHETQSGCSSQNTRATLQYKNIQNAARRLTIVLNLSNLEELGRFWISSRMALVFIKFNFTLAKVYTSCHFISTNINVFLLGFYTTEHF